MHSRDVRRAATCLPTVAAALLLAASPASRADVKSDFGVDADGWTGFGDFAVNVTWQSAGGNPGGTIKLVDSVSGGVMYWIAPAKFLGDQSGAFGRSLSFDLKQVIGTPNQFSDEDVVLVGAAPGGGSLTLVLDLGSYPATDGSWTSYSIPLAVGGWKIGTAGGAAASAAQLQSVLGGLTSLRIRAEYQTGSDTDYLDNVVLSAVPEPSAWAAMVLGLGVLGWRVRQSRSEA